MSITLKKSESYFYTVHLTKNEETLVDKMSDLKLQPSLLDSSIIYFDSTLKLKSNCDLISDFVIEDPSANLKEVYLYFNNTRLDQFEYHGNTWTLKNFREQPFLNYLCMCGNLKIYWKDKKGNRNDDLIFSADTCDENIKAYATTYTITDAYLKSSLTDKCWNVKTEIVGEKSLQYVGGVCK